MIDYIQIPRSFIYKERDNLNDFGVKTPETINHELFSNLKELYKATDRAKELILRCFNNAYYICTLIPFVDFPDTEVAAFEKKLLEPNDYACEETCVVSMAMVCRLLSAYDALWGRDDGELIERIRYRFTHYKWYDCSGIKNSFKAIAEKSNPDGLILPQNEFAPRDIIEVIDSLSARELQVYSTIICDRLARLKDPSQQTYEIDLAIAKIHDDQLELCKDTGYNPKKDCFKDADNDYRWEDKVRDKYQQSKEAIEYYTEHRPKEVNSHPEQQTADSAPTVSDHTALAAANEQLRQQLTERVSQVDKLTKENAELKKKVAEFSEPVEELTADQKVRMAFALKLLKIAGLTDDVLDENKSKVATIIHLLTDIGSKNNGTYSPTQICQNWLVHKKYYPERNTKVLIELNTLCAQLGIGKAFLNLGSQ